MNDSHANPTPLKDRRDQPDLVERIAGQAARDLPEPAALSASALARIAMRIEEQRSRPHGLRFGYVLVTASVLLGIVTVASAARMDLMPRWIAKVVGLESKPETTETPSRRGKVGTAAKKSEPRVAPENEPVPAKEATGPEAASVPEKAPEEPAKAQVPELPAQLAGPEGPTAVRRVAMAGGMAEGRGMEPGRAALGHAHDQVYGRGQDHGDDRGLGYGQGREGGSARSGKAGSYRLAAKSAGNEASSPPAVSANAGSAPSPSPDSVRMHVPVSPAPEPTERPAPPAPLAPPAPSAPAPVPPLPSPAPEPTPVAATANNPASRHLRDVVRALRIDHAPRTALELLDRHAHELAGNAFAEETLLLRVEAMLALKQHPDALRILDNTSLASTPAASVLLLTRGQLRARANRCPEAIADFDLALARTRRPAKQALLGRAQCKQKLGDSQGAQADLERLRREFPGETAP